MPKLPNLSYLLQVALEQSSERQLLASHHSKSLLREMRDKLNHIPPSPEREDFVRTLQVLEAQQFQEEAEQQKELVLSLTEEAPHLISYLTDSYQNTLNPLFLWRIYSVCRATNQVVPDIVWQYFDDCAFNLHNLVHNHKIDEVVSKKGDKGNDGAADDCLKALGLFHKGKLNAFAAMKKYIAISLLMADIGRVERENIANGMKPKDAESDAIRAVHLAQESIYKAKAISHATLYKHYKDYKKSQQP